MNEPKNQDGKYVVMAGDKRLSTLVHETQQIADAERAERMKKVLEHAQAENQPPVTVKRIING